MTGRRSLLQVLLTALLVSLHLPAAAQTQPPITPPAFSKECQAHGVNVTGATPMPNSERALRERKVLRILAIGAAPGRMSQRRGGDYLATIEQMLERLVKGLDVKVINRGISGELAANAAERIKNEVALESPDLVLWQVGTSDAFAGVAIEDLRETVVRTIHWLREHKVDVALVGLHYLRGLAQDPQYQAIRTMLQTVADEQKIPRIRRYEALQVIEQIQSKATGEPSDEFALTEEAYGCLAEYAVRAITTGVFLRPATPAADPKKP